MGFLDHSTNNIIIDASLTDVGRKLLARNDGSFSIVKFAVADDEVDYTTIEKYGRTVGKERIEKNTPVFEAQTNSNIALKYPMVSLSNPTLTRLPSFSLSANGLSGNTLSMDTSINSIRNIVIEQTIQNSTTIDVELIDTAYIVQIPNRFLQIQSETPEFVDVNEVAQYLLISNGSANAQGGSILNFSLQTKALTSTQFSVFGNANNKNIIESIVSVKGIRSGAQKDFLVQISR